MKKIQNKLSVIIVLSIFFFSCQNETQGPSNFATAVSLNDTGNKFHDYWYQGKAELTSYKLEQARYGEIHTGEAVMIFVTEHFSKSKLVKLDDPSSNHKDAVPILKLNATRKFNTGIYPYSMMSSVFTPVDLKKNPNTLKVSTSSQEWCGHTFMQANLRDNKYDVQVHSYFENEGEQHFKTDKVLLEDEIWTRLRIDPKGLPTGSVHFLPGSVYSRLRHTEYKPVEAETTLLENENPELKTYTVRYKNLDRSLSITFEKDFPYTIESWEENYKSGFGSNARQLTTRAVRNKSIMLDYWTKHNNEDLVLREKLGLE